MFQKLYRHLEEVSGNLHRQELTAEENSRCEREILQQLNILNGTINSGKLAVKPAVKRTVVVFWIVILAAACGAIGAFAIFNRRLSALNQAFVGVQEKTNRQNEWQLESRLDRLNLNGRQESMAIQLSKLDSIICQQSQTLSQLKDLNKISVHTFTRLTQRIDQTNRLILELQSDSGRHKPVGQVTVQPLQSIGGAGQ